MSDQLWHHHHDGEHRIVFCYQGDGDTGCAEQIEGYDGPVCDGFWMSSPCKYHLAHGIIVADYAGTAPLLTQLELVPESIGDG